jgi:peroxiredoxin
VSLSDFAGSPVVLLFFPLAFSPVCLDEICRAAEDQSRWNELGAQVLGISVDQVFTLQRFKRESGAEFPLLSDFNKEVIAAYDVLNEDFFGARGVAYRSAFVVDGEGKIAWSWMTEDASILPDFDEIAGVLEGLRG